LAAAGGAATFGTSASGTTSKYIRAFRIRSFLPSTNPPYQAAVDTGWLFTGTFDAAFSDVEPRGMAAADGVDAEGESAVCLTVGKVTCTDDYVSDTIR
jgi:hypothetical protein